MGSVEAERWCFRFFSWTRAAAGVAEVEPDPDAVWPGFGGMLRSDAGTSTWAKSIRQIKFVVDSRPLQFLIWIISSMSPSYVSWVSKGVIMSTRRSMTMSESKASELSSKPSWSILVRWVVWRVRRSASRYKTSDAVVRSSCYETDSSMVTLPSNPRE
jgi:hypothetical protein